MQKDKEQFWVEVWEIIAQGLKKISDIPEDEEKLRKIWKFYQRKRTVAGGQAKALAAGILYVYSRINFLNYEQKPWRQGNIAVLCGVSESTAGTKSKQIMQGLKMDMMDQRFARESVAEKNPWNKMMVDPKTGFLFMESDEMDIPGVHLKPTKDDYYFDAMEALEFEDTEAAIRLLKKSLEIDEHFLRGFVGLAAAWLQKGNFAKHQLYVNEGFADVKKIYPKWPERMEWGYLDNRPALRIICYKAAVEHILGNKSEAEQLYRLLLQFTPNDNQGVRYLLAAMFAGMRPEYVDQLTDEGNAKQNWDKLENLLDTQNAIHHFWHPARED